MGRVKKYAKMLYSIQWMLLGNWEESRPHPPANRYHCRNLHWPTLLGHMLRLWWEANFGVNTFEELRGNFSKSHPSQSCEPKPSACHPSLSSELQRLTGILQPAQLLSNPQTVPDLAPPPLCNRFCGPAPLYAAGSQISILIVLPG